MSSAVEFTSVLHKGAKKTTEVRFFVSIFSLSKFTKYC